MHYTQGRRELFVDSWSKINWKDICKRLYTCTKSRTSTNAPVNIMPHLPSVGNFNPMGGGGGGETLMGGSFHY